MKPYVKRDFPVSNIRRFLEPGPVVLVSSAWKGETNVMTLGWHMVLEFRPSLVACCIAETNHSFGLIRGSRECVINVPAAALGAAVADIGNTSGRDIDKFRQFGLTARPARKVKAPLIAECFASFECRLADATLIRRYGLFVFECVKAHAVATPPFPQTLHYRGDGLFMLAGPTTAKWRRRFRPGML